MYSASYLLLAATTLRGSRAMRRSEESHAFHRVGFSRENSRFTCSVVAEAAGWWRVRRGGGLTLTLTLTLVLNPKPKPKPKP